MKRIACLVLVLMGGCASSQKMEMGDQEAIKSGFGESFVDTKLGWTHLDKPSKVLKLDAARFEFKQVGKDDEHHEATLKRDGEHWRFDLGTGTVLLLRVEDDGSVVIDSSEDLEHKVLSKYSPPEPLLRADARPGKAQTIEIDVTVHPISDPSRVRYTGHLTLDYRVLGRYQVTVPAGTFDAVLLSWHYEGKVGPANVREVNYWFVAPGVGPVAILTREDVSAMLVYNDRTDRASVLVERKGPN